MSNTANTALYRLPLFPFLIVVSPVLSTFSLNTWGLSAVDWVRPTILHIAFALLSYIISKIIVGTPRSAAVLSCIPIISVISFGHVSNWIYTVYGSSITDLSILLTWFILTVGIFALLAHILRKSSHSLLKLTAILNTFGLVFIFLALIPLVLSRLATAFGPEITDSQDLVTESVQHEWLSSNVSPEKIQDLPDFYFIIMDAYARGDVLESRFDLNNTQFLSWLESKGFFVASSSHSNYAWTHLSLGSTLNAEYLQSLIPGEVKENFPEDHLDRFQYYQHLIGSRFIRNSRVYRFFSSLEYHLVSNYWPYKSVRKEQNSLSVALFGPLNKLEHLLLKNSIFRPVFSKSQRNNTLKKLGVWKYDNITEQLDSLVSFTQHDSPKFVFQHIISPHEPFCFDSDGGPVSMHPHYDFTDWIDKYSVPGYKDWFKENYPKNIAGLNHHLKLAIQNILEASQGNAIIILQSDHGSALGLNPLSLEQSDLVERFGILNAIFLPAKYERNSLIGTMSSVNTFPIILNNVFNLDLPLQKDRAYYSEGDLEFVDVTNYVQ